MKGIVFALAFLSGCYKIECKAMCEPNGVLFVHVSTSTCVCQQAPVRPCTPLVEEPKTP